MNLGLLVLMTLGAYRLWRLLAHDDLPPAMWARDRVEAWTDRRFGPTWAAGVRCPWCGGWWSSVVVAAAVWHFVPLPLPALWFGAVSTLVGLIAQRDEDQIVGLYDTGQAILAAVDTIWTAAGVDLPDARYVSPGPFLSVVNEDCGQVVVSFDSITRGRVGEPVSNFTKPPLEWAAQVTVSIWRGCMPTSEGEEPPAIEDQDASAARVLADVDLFWKNAKAILVASGCKHWAVVQVAPLPVEGAMGGSRLVGSIDLLIGSQMPPVTFRVRPAGMNELLRYPTGAVARDIRAKLLAIEVAAKQRCPKDEGTLRTSSVIEVRPGPKGAVGTLTFTAPHALFVHEGTRPHWPPIQALAGWAARHGFPNPFLVARAIALHGTKGVPFLWEGLQSVMARARRRGTLSA